MDINEQILNELKQINITLSKIASTLPSQGTVSARPSGRDMSTDIEDRIKKARQEAELKIAKLKSGLPGL